ncbi:transcription repressor OFP1-like [Humulus lupulus]|uniref:transcription repressor OFP1-like n=1 Tax=Humulus lupulus TaxID=3486 RepID=UPI002B400B73|nr:transcription repressor OFP1-like [Humulus lupulus]
MGNNKFRLSDMIPNAWFYKLKDMSKTRKQNNTRSTKKKLTPVTSKTQQNPQLSHPRYAPTEPTTTTNNNRSFSPSNSKPSRPHLPDPPRKSSKKIARRKAISIPHPSLKPVWINPNPLRSPDYSVSGTESCSEPDHSRESIPSEFDCDDYVRSDPFVGLASWSSSCNCRLSSSTADIIIDLNNGNGDGPVKKTEKLEHDFYDVVTELELPPILTKPINFDDTIFEATKYRPKLKEESCRTTRRESKSTNNNNNVQARKSSSGSNGIKLRTNSPKLASKKIQAYARKSISARNNKHLAESFAVVKSSIDPQSDFKESMVEMIVENNIKGSKDLEELLACYLSLNSKEYHDIIVKAFEQIWFDMAHVRV